MFYCNRAKITGEMTIKNSNLSYSSIRAIGNISLIFNYIIETETIVDEIIEYVNSSKVFV